MRSEINGGGAGIGGMITEPGRGLNTCKSKERKMKMLFWNIAGIGNKDGDFWKYTQEFDVINLSET